jgi:hypothetical protein
MGRSMSPRTHSGLDNVLSAGAGPRNLGGILLAEDTDGLALNDELAIFDLDGALEATVRRIILEHVHLEGT